MFGQVAGEDLAAEALDVTEGQRTALDDVVLGQEAELFAGLGVEHKDVTVVVYAVELAVVVYKVANIGGVIAFGFLIAFLLGDIPFLGKLAQRRSGYGSGDVDYLFEASTLDLDIEFGFYSRAIFAVCADFIGDFECDGESAAGFWQRAHADGETSRGVRCNGDVAAEILAGYLNGCCGVLVLLAGEVDGRGADGERGGAGRGLGAGGYASPVECADVFVAVAISGPVIGRVTTVPVGVAGAVVVAVGVVADKRAGLGPSAGAVGSGSLVGTETEDHVAAGAVFQANGVRIVVVGLGAEYAPRGGEV